MTRSRVLLFAAVASLTLLGAAPPHHLSPCLNGPFDGITQTLPDGTIVGEPDAKDWGCVGHAQGASPAASARAAAMRARLAETDPGVAGVPVPPPGPLCLEPAAPNPASFQTKLQFALPASGHVTLSVYGRSQGHGPRETTVVRELLDGNLAAGIFIFYWDLTDDNGNRLPAGIYRVVLVSGDDALCGDIEIQ
jgi:hypothetical protein